MIKKIVLYLILFSFSTAAFSSVMIEEISRIQERWAEIKYLESPDEQAADYEKLLPQTDHLVAAYPNNAEPLVWSAIVYSSYAGAVGGLQSITKSLPAVKKARNLLQQAEMIDSMVLDGAVYTSLGALYYQVPGWPLGFGNKDLARSYLEKAVSVSQNGLDANFFYGDFLISEKNYSEAITVLERALVAPAKPDRPVADAGRRNEIREKLELARSKVS